MNHAATVFAQPPERRRCGRPSSARLDRTRPIAHRPPNRTTEHSPRVQIRTVPALRLSFTAPPHHRPDRSPEGDTA